MKCSTMEPDLLPCALAYAETGIVTPERMRAVDANAQALGVSGLQLMESAGRALAGTVLSYNPKTVLVLCGRGNNGGDGMAAARYLQRGVDTTVCYLDRGERSPSCARELAALKGARVTLRPFVSTDDLRTLAPYFGKADVIVDALLGTGTAGALREPLATCIAMANGSPATIVAADLPSPGMRADRICAFHRPKVQGSEVIDIGIPLEAEICTGPGDLTLIPARKHTRHKGDGGSVLVIGGGPYQGAPYLAGLGALRAGADIVRIASPVFEPVPDLIYERLPGDRITEEHTERLIALAETADAVICGNGLGAESHAVTGAVAPHCRKAVFDADALRFPLVRAAKETVYTPHAGEFARIAPGNPLPADAADACGRAKAARAAAGEAGATILLKGPVDVITDGARVRFNRTGDPAMSVGGTGDVLAGVTGALLCHLPAFEAACIAAYVTGRAGERVAQEKGAGMLASDLVHRIPEELYRRDP
ncbi:NAD(P)H-hydrate dehydratase [Methanoregula sp. UBA64]|jgi:ADP-dependent NAD(P)H-hydrate dehydratase / NAD(P)H-hydrate epimerase|uniref:NAD(P)H-hydrate dehydratase n=1 Tax=Methanoregula sp. UBA64 TaxID=1915554 RepID=UPI0025E3B183|nr:NAD(P)H-hydrate dehydratase [Methanoregula sp. UBA64]